MLFTSFPSFGLTRKKKKKRVEYSQICPLISQLVPESFTGKAEWDLSNLFERNKLRNFLSSFPSSPSNAHKCQRQSVFYVCLFVLVAQSCWLCDSMDCSPPGSSVHGILQPRILEWVAISFFRGSSRPRNWTPVFCIAGRFFTLCAIREA